MKKIKVLMTTGLIVVVFAITGCGQSQITKVEPTKQATAPTATPPKQEVHNLKVGDTVKIDGLEWMLNSVEQVKQGKNEFEKPKKAKFLVIDMTVKNVSTDVQNVSSMLQIQLQNDQGYKEDFTFGVLDQKGSIDGELQVGRMLRGQMVFDVAESKSYDLMISNVLQQGQAIFKLTDIPARK